MVKREDVNDLSADNRRLRMLLDQGRLPAELRHRQRAIMALWRSIIQRSPHPTPEVEEFAG